MRKYTCEMCTTEISDGILVKIDWTTADAEGQWDAVGYEHYCSPECLNTNRGVDFRIFTPADDPGKGILGERCDVARIAVMSGQQFQ